MASKAYLLRKAKRQNARRKARAATDLEYRRRRREIKKRSLQRRFAADPEYRARFHREKNLQSNYGIATEDYDVLMQSQDGKCGICGLEPTVGQKRLAVDHDHETEYIRGLLCMGCNTGIGKFKHDVRLLQRAIEWIS